MNLYYGGFGRYLDYTVAKTDEDAIKQISDKFSIHYLPVSVKPIDIVDGYKITPVKEGEKVEVRQEKQSGDNGPDSGKAKQRSAGTGTGKRGKRQA